MANKSTDEAEVRQLIEERVRATREKDIDAALSNIAPDIESFDVVDPLKYVGSNALRTRAQEWFSSFEGPIAFEVRELSITTGEDVAFSHSLNRVTGTKADGGQLDMWFRATVCYRRIDGRWMVTHEHNSVPFNVESGKASLDLKP
jgi:uncharacterized protein (TIGR02246 family)